MELIDNIHKTFAEDLRSTLTTGSRMSIAASCFSIYAYQELRKELEHIEELRFIFTSPTFIADKTNKEQREFYIPRLNRERSLTGNEFEILLRNELTQKAIARECAEWIRRKVKFKSNKTKENMMGFGVVDSTSYMPLTGFTTVDLGVERGDNVYTMIQKAESPFSQHYTQLFEQLWNDKERLQDVTNEVVESISSVYKENPPELLYFITLFNIFREFLDDISEDVLPNEATGFKETAVWKKLYKFQQDASLGIINKLEKYNGCILADSVGLGKTFTAISVIKYYELRNKSVLVLCPKKLYDNWITYRSNYKNNPLATDRLRYDVLYHTDLGRSQGLSNGIDLEKINWGNYDLVVIDESHNFRNGGKISTDEDDLNPRKNRYLRLLDDVIRDGVKTKVLMLSATPVNNRFNDLKNQLELAYEGDVEAFDQLLNTESSIDDIFRQAQVEYNRWSKLPEVARTTEALLDALSFDFFEVLDSVTIARSRRHIEQYYDTAEIGSFPERLPVLSRRPQLSLDTQLISYNTIYSHLSDLNLAIYTPSDFILKSRVDKYQSIDDEGNISGLSRSGRELGIRRLMCINMLKRLESSVHSFRLTLQHLVVLLTATLEKVDQVERGEAIAVGEYNWDEGFDIDDLNDELLIGGGKTTIDLRDMDYLGWKNYLATDLATLQFLLDKTACITPQYDAKLQSLFSDIEHKVATPINSDNKKVIVFTAFSDTAEYLYNSLAETLLKRHSLHSVLITGGIDARSTLKLPGRQKMTFNTALTLFSPVSKDKHTILPEVQGEIDILIATDCISEGQNLQDCDYLINYDIHWNPVRIIQRFGRIDRIGSHNSCIQMVNYWPDIQLDEYINLKARVENRMKVSVMTSTGDDNLLSNEEKGDLEYRRKQLERLQTEVVDLEEMNTGISILDLGLNEFRLDLLDYVKKHGSLEEARFGLHTVVRGTESLPPGVIYILKNRNSGVNIDRKNQLHPFYMVYISMDGEVVVNHLQPKKMLDRLRQACRGQSSPYADLCKDFNRETGDGRRMDTYSRLLGESIQSIITVKEQSDVLSFLEGASGDLFSKEIKGLDDFELICFFIVR